MNITNVAFMHGEERVDWKTIHSIDSYYKTGAWPQVCRTGLRKLLLNKEPTFKQGQKTYTTAQLQPHFRDLIRQYWIPFTAQCMDELLTAGFVVFEYHPTASGDYVPVILKSVDGGREHDVTIKRDRKTMRDVFTVYSLKDENGNLLPVPQPRENARVLMDHGYEPCLDGSIRSRLGPLQTIESKYAQIRTFALDTEYNLARPAVFIQCDDTAAASMNPTLNRLPYSHVNARRARETGSGMFNSYRDPQILARFQGTLQERKERLIHDMAEITTGGELKATPYYIDNMVFLPPGMTPVNAAQPQRMPNFDKMMDRYENDVCALFGFPRSLFVQDVANRGTGNTVLTNDTLRHTMMELIHMLSVILTRVHEDLYGKEDHMLEAQKQIRKKRHLAPGDFFKVVRDAAEVRVTLPAPPSTDLEMLERLYALKVVPWREMHDGSRAISGLPPSDAPAEPTVDELAKRIAMISGQRADPKVPTAGPSGSSAGKSSAKKAVSKASASAKTQSKTSSKSTA